MQDNIFKQVAFSPTSQIFERVHQKFERIFRAIFSVFCVIFARILSDFWEDHDPDADHFADVRKMVLSFDRPQSCFNFAKF